MRSRSSTLRLWGAASLVLGAIGAAAPAGLAQTGTGIVWSGAEPIGTDVYGAPTYDYYGSSNPLASFAGLANLNMITQSTQLAAVSVYGDFIAVDQPRVAWMLENPNPGVNDEPIVGPSEFFPYAILDTGANGIVIGAAGYFDFDWEDYNAGYYYDRYARATRTDGSYVGYTETGVAGTEVLDVLAPYNLNIWGRSSLPVDENVPTPATFAIDNSTILGAVHRDRDPLSPTFNYADSAADFGSYSAIIGMPAMNGRVVEMDLRPIAGWFGIGTRPEGVPDFNLIFAEFHSVMPEATANSLTVTLTPLILPPELTQPQQEGDPVPTFADVPLLDVTAKNYTANGTYSVTRKVLLDTGAQTSILSTRMVQALNLNLDENDPNSDYVDLDGDGDFDQDDMLEVGGLGGSTYMPLVLIDDLVIPTVEGTDIVVHQLVVGVLDIGGEGDDVLLDGVFGMNILTSGYADLIFAGDGQYGRFTQIFLDFTEDGNWSMRLEVNPDFAAAAPEPASLSVVFLGALGLLKRRRRTA